MTHRHEWKLVEDGPECDECKYWATIAVMKCECGQVYGPTEIERRLNATECLTAGQADTAASLIRGHTVKEKLKDYCKTLKGDSNE